MIAMLEHLAGPAGWVGRTSAQACLPILLILATQALLRDRLSPRWRYALWTLLLLRLALPWAPESPLSAYNLVHPARAWMASGVPWTGTESGQAARGEAPENPGNRDGAASLGSPRWTRQPASGQPSATRRSQDAPGPDNGNLLRQPQPSTPSVAATTPPAPLARPGLFSFAALAAWLPLVWLAGVFLVAASAIAQSLSMTAAVRRRRCVADPATLALLKACKAEMGVRAPLRMVEMERLGSPALFGVARPVLLLPLGAIADLGPARLRHVFLHELAHLRRRDIAVNWLMTALQALHWFNPLVWIAFARMRTDRELACDALALSCARSGEPADYGRTFVHLLEQYSRPRRLPGLAGVMEKHDHMKRRIAMIAGFRKTPGRWPVLAVLLFAALAAVSLTNAQTQEPKETKEAKATKEAVAGSKAEMMGRVEDFMMHNYRDITARKPIEWGEVETDAAGNRSIRLKQEAKIWDKDLIITNEIFIFSPQGEFVSVKKVDGFPHVGMVALVEDFFLNNFRDITARDDIEWGEATKTADGNSSIRYKYNATLRDGGKEIMNQVFTFDPTGKFVSVENVEDMPAPGEVRPAPRVYTIDKAARDFPAQEDLSTPETAWAAICRVNAEPDQFKAWQRLSVAKLASHSTEAMFPRGPASPEVIEQYLNARILEIRAYGDTKAAVIFQKIVSGKPMVMVRLLQLEDGRWLNKGEDIADTVESARAKLDKYLGPKVATEAKPSDKDPGKVDITIEGFEVVPYPEGGLYELNLSHRNKGEKACPPFEVLFYQGDPDKGGKLIHGERDNVGPIEPGETFGERNSPFALHEGENEFTAVVDPDHKVLPEQNGKNRATLKVAIKDGKLVDQPTAWPTWDGKSPRPSFIPETSTIGPDGHIVDKTDLPFVDDPAVIGTWKSLDFVADPDQFKPGEKQWKGDLSLKELFFQPNGKTPQPWLTWTKGMVLHSGDKTASRYTLKEVDDEPFLFIEWKGGDYVAGHKKPSYYVLKRSAGEAWNGKDPRPPFVPETSSLDANGHIVDKIDLPFVDDPAVVGTWRSWDFVREPEMFKPGEKKEHAGDLVLLSGGKTPSPSETWTNGLILNSKAMTASRYTLKELDGATYLFMEQKSGTYGIYRKKPLYHVLKKE